LTVAISVRTTEEAPAAGNVVDLAGGRVGSLGPRDRNTAGLTKELNVVETSRHLEYVIG
jgi:hypothetical protein